MTDDPYKKVNPFKSFSIQVFENRDEGVSVAITLPGKTIPLKPVEIDTNVKSALWRLIARAVDNNTKEETNGASVANEVFGRQGSYEE